MIGPRRGLTLLETMISAVLLGMITAMLFWVYRMGAGAMMKGQAQTALLQDAQTCTSRLLREVERSNSSSLSLDPPLPGGPATAAAFLSAIDVNGRFAYDPAVGEPVWQKYVVFYYDAPTQEIRWLEVPLAAGSPEARLPRPIDSYLAGGPAPLSAYRMGGRTVARNVTRCEFSIIDGLLSLLIEARQKRYGSDAPEFFTLQTAGAFRN